MGIPDFLICVLGNLYSGQEATVRTGHGTIDWFQIGERVHQGCILSLHLFNCKGIQPVDLKGNQRHTWLNDWTDLINTYIFSSKYTLSTKWEYRNDITVN